MPITSMFQRGAYWYAQLSPNRPDGWVPPKAVIASPESPTCCATFRTRRSGQRVDGDRDEEDRQVRRRPVEQAHRLQRLIPVRPPDQPDRLDQEERPGDGGRGAV